MLHMDGKRPSGFTYSSFCGMNDQYCSDPPSQENVIVDYSEVARKSSTGLF